MPRSLCLECGDEILGETPMNYRHPRCYVASLQAALAKAVEALKKYDAHEKGVNCLPQPCAWCGQQNEINAALALCRPLLPPAGEGKPK